MAMPRGFAFSLATLQSLKTHLPFLPGPEPMRVDDPSALKAPSALPEAPQSSAPNLPISFQGITDTGWIPPDNGTAAGPNHIVEMVNTSWRAFSKTGAAATALIPFCGSGGWWSAVLPAGVTQCFDPRILYDQFSNRWVMLAVATRSSPNRAWYLLATSWTSDPTGQWCRWSLDATLNGSTSTGNWADYPQLGLDSQALYITSNQFSFSGGEFQYVKLRIAGKAQLYNNMCASVSWRDFWNLADTDGTAAFTVQPAFTFGTPGVEYLINSRSSSGSSVTLWSLTNPLSASPTLTRVDVPVGSYSLPPNASQCGGATALDTGDARLLNAVYRNGSLWTTHTIASGSESRARYLRIDPSGPTVLEDFAFGSSGFFYYYPALMIDGADNVYTVFNRSSASECVGIRYAGRLSTDPAGTLQESGPLQNGVASYEQLDNSGRNRWGDYSGIAPDPADPGKVWIAGAYVAAMDSWATWIGQLALGTNSVTFSGWAPLPGGGATLAGPAVVIFNGEPWVFVRGTNNRIYRNLLTASSWSGWSEVPGGGLTPSSPGATVFNNTLYLFVRGTNNRIYRNLLSASGW
ncbi:MAG TPA: hypothetical protein VGX03_11290, partial [Candidatus Binatia bacterium]|nr:hypothetical protein [Candidatus Binatia bacterium]